MIWTKRLSVIINRPLYTDRQRIISSYTLTQLSGSSALNYRRKSVVQSVLSVWIIVRQSTKLKWAMVELDLIEDELLNISHWQIRVKICNTNFKIWFEEISDRVTTCHRKIREKNSPGQELVRKFWIDSKVATFSEMCHKEVASLKCSFVFSCWMFTHSQEED